MAATLLTYAGTLPVYEKNRDALVHSARRYGGFTCVSFGPADIDPEFRTTHAGLLAEPKGGGLYLWKPYFICRMLSQMAPGEILIYADSGLLFRQPVAELTARLGQADLLVFENDHTNRGFVKRDAYQLSGTDSAQYHDAPQLDAALIVMRNTGATRDLINRWLDLCCDRRALSDDASVCGLPELPGFLKHRHDQALLTLLLAADPGGVKAVRLPRAEKYRYAWHHRRRTVRIPIWLWHLFHDAVFETRRRITRR